MSNTLEQPSVDFTQFFEIQGVLDGFPRTAKDLKLHPQRKDFALKQRGEKPDGPMTHSELGREYYDFLQFLFYQAIDKIKKSGAPEDVILEGIRDLDQIEQNLYYGLQVAMNWNHKMDLSDRPVSIRALSF